MSTIIPRGGVAGLFAIALALSGSIGLWLTPGSASAVPAFATQTGQSCQACHVGGFGPQLTAYGRAFKIRGYTSRSGGWTIPVSAMLEASYVHTSKPQTAPPADGYDPNNNFSLDQLSLFLAGGLGDHLGAFAQVTYDGVGKAWHWDNLDVRAVTNASLHGHDAVVGMSLNNAPGVQDPWNTLQAWGFPYAASALTPGAPAAPIMGAFAQTTLGVTAYAWIDNSLYLEAGGYQSPSESFITHLGADPTSPGSIAGIAPYVRLAWQKAVGSRTYQIGGFFYDAAINPALDLTTGLHDHYTDLGVDGSVLATLPSGDTLTFNARYTHERQNLRATQALGDSANSRLTLDDLRFDLSYYYRNHYGLTVGAFDTWGSRDSILFGGTANEKPDTSGVMLQVDATPWGAGRSPLGPRFNTRVGAQFTHYFSYAGSALNYDLAGRDAADNDAFRLFLWVAY